MNPINVTGYDRADRLDLSAGAIHWMLPICCVAGIPVDCDRSTSRSRWRVIHRQVRLLARNNPQFLVNPPIITNAQEGIAK